MRINQIVPSIVALLMAAPEAPKAQPKAQPKKRQEVVLRRIQDGVEWINPDIPALVSTSFYSKEAN